MDEVNRTTRCVRTIYHSGVLRNRVKNDIGTWGHYGEDIEEISYH